MESFINRCLWLMSLSEVRRLKDTINELKQQLASSPQSTSAHLSSHTTTSTSNSNNSNSGTSTTSPNEIPPSPASSVGSSIGSTNGTNSNNNNSNSNNNNNQQQTSTSATTMSNQQLTHQQLTQKLLHTYDNYYRINEYNMKSHTFWETNEHQITDVKYLSGKF
jgi:hypothetical protein